MFEAHIKAAAVLQVALFGHPINLPGVGMVVGNHMGTALGVQDKPGYPPKPLTLDIDAFIGASQLVDDNELDAALEKCRVMKAFGDGGVTNNDPSANVVLTRGAQRILETYAGPAPSVDQPSAIDPENL